MSNESETEISEEELVNQLIADDLGLDDSEEESVEITAEDVYEGLDFEKESKEDEQEDPEPKAEEPEEEPEPEEKEVESEPEAPAASEEEPPETEDPEPTKPRMIEIPAAEIKRVRHDRKQFKTEAAEASAKAQQLETELSRIKSQLEVLNVELPADTSGELGGEAIEKLKEELSPEAVAIIKSLTDQVNDLQKGVIQESSTQTDPSVEQDAIEEALLENPWLYNLHSANMAALNDVDMSDDDRDAAQLVIDDMVRIENKVSRKPEFAGNDVESLTKRYAEVERLLREKVKTKKAKAEQSKPEKALPDSLVATGAAKTETDSGDQTKVGKAMTLVDQGNMESFYTLYDSMNPTEKAKVDQELGII